MVIPVYNEEGSIDLLIQRIDAASGKNGINYEIIFIDDHSIDRTREVIQSLKKSYPIFLFLKKGVRGKAQSILEGISYSHFDFVVMIDADMQYPPEAIPEMMAKIESGADIVVGRRINKEESLLRNIFSRTYHFIFVRLLHQINVDAQSGLKIFRKEIFENLDLKPTPWSFDTEFLVKAKAAGHTIESVDILFYKRFAGKSKVNLIKTSLEIAGASLRLKILGPGIIPFTNKKRGQKGEGFYFLGKEFIHYGNLEQEDTAFKNLDSYQLLFVLIFFLIIANSFFNNSLNTIILLIAIIISIYLVDLVFSFYITTRNFGNSGEMKINPEDITAIDEENLPLYTILCPLYKEWTVLDQFLGAMSRLDYPNNKLQILLLFEQDDIKTMAAAGERKLPSFFEIVIVPDSKPKTKPKALNYGLRLTRGEYCVVYDAEDIPDPLQLKKAILAFAKSGPRTACIQAKLNFFNSTQNLLTRLFTAEYYLWFDLILPGLQDFSGPIPLGGTSNHFKKSYLIDAGGWDAFNVAEDCDLGIRLDKKGFTTKILDSITLEEASSSLKNWLPQRTRWIKGYIQSYLVHMRKISSEDFLNPLKQFTFQLLIGGKALLLFINPFMWLMTLVYFSMRKNAGIIIESFFPPWIFYLGVFSTVFGNFLYFYCYMIACAKKDRFDLIKFIFFVPFYWILMSIAAWRAFVEIIAKPHYWPKTNHGIYLQKTSPP